MKYIFIDTNVFIDAITSNDGAKALSSLSTLLKKKKVKLLMPEVIKMEILTQYSYWKAEVIEKAASNLTTRKILGVEDLTEKKKKQQRGGTEVEKIDSIIDADRSSLLGKIESHYKHVSEKIDEIFKNDYSNIVELTDEMLLSGMRRSLLKKSPYTRTEKSTESAHTKDIDCIAFESLMIFISTFSNDPKKDRLIMCVSDKDYVSEAGQLHDDIKSDIKMKHACYGDLSSMFSKEFKVKVKSTKEKIVSSNKQLTLSPDIPSIQSSESNLFSK